MHSTSRLAAIAAVVPFVVFAAVYVPMAGHGLIQDDFSWILRSRVASLTDVIALFRSDNGFYRPMVSLTFAVNEWMFGATPYGYGLTNAALALACAWAIGGLARALGLPRGAAVLASALWLLNLHGIRMAVLWVSGRTALVLTLAAVLAATALVRGRLVPALAWLAVALLAKEEAVLLPAILLAWIMWLGTRDEPGPVRPISWIGGAGIVTALYFLARSTTRAMTPMSAPPFYTPTFELAALWSNIVSYADRALTFPLVVALLAVVLLGRPHPWMDRRTLTLFRCGAAWLAGGFALTVFLPVRSDLYACFPSVGAALAAAAFCGRAWEQSTPIRQQRSLIASLLVSMIVGMLHYSRTGRWVEIADFSSAVMADLRAETSSLRDHATIVIQDDRRQRVNLGSAFGTLIEEAYALSAGRRLTLWVEPPPVNADLAGLKAPCLPCADLRLAVVDGRLRREP